MNTKILNAREAVRLLVETHPEILQDSWYPTLFAGDRMSCCDEAAIVEVNAWADTLTQDQMDWVLAQFTPHAKVFDDVREEWEGLKAKWAGKSYSAV